MIVCMIVQTSPKTTCLPSSHSVFSVQIKNWLPLVLGPEDVLFCVVSSRDNLSALNFEKAYSSELKKGQTNMYSVTKITRILLTWVSHGQYSRFCVFQHEVLILKLFTEHTFTSSTIMVGKVTSLTHETRYYPVKLTATISKTETKWSKHLSQMKRSCFSD